MNTNTAEKLTERRKSKRFTIDTGLYAIVNSRKNIKNKFGQIKNISKDGLAFQYVEDESEMKNPDEMDIIMIGKTQYIRKVQFKIISDYQINDDPTPPIKIRRCGVQFKKLNQTQIFFLNDFITEHRP